MKRGFHKISAAAEKNSWIRYLFRPMLEGGGGVVQKCPRQLIRRNRKLAGSRSISGREIRSDYLKNMQVLMTRRYLRCLA